MVRLVPAAPRGPGQAPSHELGQTNDHVSSVINYLFGYNLKKELWNELVKNGNGEKRRERKC